MSDPERATAPAGERGRLRLLQLAALTSTCDRFAIAPLIVVIALDLDVSFPAAAGVASAYFVAYGVMQPVWGMVSDRIGRVRVMRVALLVATAAGIGSALAPNLLLLAGTRVLAGASFAALIPASLVYVGDFWPEDVRQRPLADVMAASSLGIAVATAGAGVLADVAGWRTVPALAAVAAAALWVALRRLPEPDRLPASGNPLRSIWHVLSTPWAQVVLLFALVEGAVVLGVLTYLAPAVQSLGGTAALAGSVAAAYGLGALLFTRVVRRLVGRLTPATLAGIGGGFLVAAWGVPALGVSVGTVAVAGLLVGGSWAFLHSTLQAWATQVVPTERATTVALFATMLFLGSGLGTALAAGPAGAGAYPELFRVGLATAIPLAVAVVVARARYARSR